ncbi:hypothetical protein V6N00_13500 [Tersicoccus sp. MR15.9]|uniref:deoxynucleotide monophosphate kinase family protein n=1 Tax=Tersicoccus mangrovi TaxID=3121635 RepID=UPI002FE69AA6
MLIGLHGHARSGKDTAGAHLTHTHGCARFAFGDNLKNHMAAFDPRLGGTISLTMALGQIEGGFDALTQHRIWGPEVRGLLKRYATTVRDVFGDTRTDAELVDDLLTLDPMLEGRESIGTVLARHNGWEGAKDDRFDGGEVRRLLQAYGTEVARATWGPTVWVDLLATQIRTARARDVVITDVRFDSEAEWITGQGGFVLEVARPGTVPVNGHASEAGIDPTYIAATIRNDSSITVLGQRLDTAVANLSAPQDLAA